MSINTHNGAFDDNADIKDGVSDNVIEAKDGVGLNKDADPIIFAELQNTDEKTDKNTDETINNTTDENTDEFNNEIKNDTGSVNNPEQCNTYPKTLSTETFAEKTDDLREKRKKIIIRSLRIIFTIGFVVFSALFINEVLIQPYKLKKTIEKARELYNYTDYIDGQDNRPEEIQDNNTDMNNSDSNPDIDNADDNAETLERDPDSDKGKAALNDPNRDEMGRLIKFKKLLEVNDDVKGWIRIDNINGENDTKIDYVVVQSGPEDPEFYLTRDWATKSYLKAGSIFLDYASSVETGTKNLVIHGHNMTSSDDMFHYLIKYKELDFLKEHPLIRFDTIYEEGLWKIFSVFITPGDNKRGDFFSFNRSTFKDDKDFLEFVYQVRVRSLFNIIDVDINENDRILTLSTCSYELDNYRIIVVARKVRENEDATVNTDNIKKNKNVLYPESFYKHYGGKPPVIPTFEAALQDGLIPWYNPMDR